MIRLKLVFHVVHVRIEWQKHVSLLFNFNKRNWSSCCHTPFENALLVVACLNLLGVVNLVPLLQLGLKLVVSNFWQFGLVALSHYLLIIKMGKAARAI